jgi:DNA-binding IscR family transcriptional regulator
VAHELWRDLDRIIDQRLGSITLADLVIRQAEKNADPLMYHI